MVRVSASPLDRALKERGNDLALYESTFEIKYFSTARELANQILQHFTDLRGGFFDTSDDHENLVVRPKDVQDNATPSGGAMATMVLFKLAAYTGHPGYVEGAEAAVAMIQPALAQAPTGFAWWLNALDFELAPPKEIAIVGEAAEPLFEVVFGEYRPNQVVAYTPVQEQDLPIPLLGDRPQIGGKATAYVCLSAGFSCATGAKNRTLHFRVPDAGDGGRGAGEPTEQLICNVG